MLALRELCKHLHSPSIHIIFIVEVVCFILENGKIHMIYVKSCCVSCKLICEYCLRANILCVVACEEEIFNILCVHFNMMSLVAGSVAGT